MPILLQRKPCFGAQKPRTIHEQDVLDFLSDRKGFLDGICVGGGEPTIHKELPIFLSKVKELDFLVKVDTNGSKPKMLKRLIDEGLVDYIAMDVKVKNGGKLFDFLSEGELREFVRRSHKHGLTVALAGVPR